MEYGQNSDTGPIVDFQADSINQSQIIDMAEVHRSETESSIALELPILNESGTQTFTLPVSFDNQDEPLVDEIELNNITLEETNKVPSDLWNSELEAIFGLGSMRRLKGEKKSLAKLVKKSVKKIKCKENCFIPNSPPPLFQIAP